MRVFVVVVVACNGPCVPKEKWYRKEHILLLLLLLSSSSSSGSSSSSSGSLPRAHLHVVGMLRFMFDINQPSLPAPFYSVLVSISVFMALSTVFDSINSPDNSPLSNSVFLVLFLPYWFFQLYILSLYESLLQP